MNARVYNIDTAKCIILFLHLFIRIVPSNFEIQVLNSCLCLCFLINLSLSNVLEDSSPLCKHVSKQNTEARNINEQNCLEK